MATPAVISRALGRGKALIGMVHVPALPGSPASKLAARQIAAHVAAEARLLAKTGFDALLLENMHDAPYLTRHDPAVVAAMTAAGLAVRDAAPDLPMGVQVLAAGNREALAVALACGGTFIRCENFVFAHVADEGLMPTAEAGELLRYRRSIGAESVAVFADLKKKHASHAITGDVSLAEAC
ncbi:MAG TPA: BtpA/SgcQ family protein, partial [Phycisphaerales bacterium]|nr:BtpA/SgcQ family protein [Phycisphaerales bacterium]